MITNRSWLLLNTDQEYCEHNLHLLQVCDECDTPESEEVSYDSLSRLSTLFASSDISCTTTSPKELIKMTKNSTSRIAWIDVESNGKSPRDGSRLLQVACIITDADLNELNDGFELKIYYTPAEVRALYAAADHNVRMMHEKTGLWDLLPTEGKPLKKVEERFLEELKLYIPEDEGRWTPIGGNSITLDRDFLMTEMPSITDFLSYQSYDMSSVARHFKNNLPEAPKFEKKYTHDALDDIRESIGEAKYYSQLLKDLVGGN